MPASLRLEIFPKSMAAFLDFYTKVLQFEIRKHQGTYAFLKRDNIYIGAIESPTADSSSDRESYRRPVKGVEIVFEVDDLVAERDRIVGQEWKIEEDIKLQEWGLEDFRLVDPDGYYIRITTHSTAK